MKKAVLVMGMPKSCAECIVCNLAICRSAHELIPLKGTERPDWCPLRELPEKKERRVGEHGERMFRAGFNACLNKIAGGV